MKRTKRKQAPRRKGRPGKSTRKRIDVDTKKSVGELRLHRDGYGFVIADKPGTEDVFVPARFIGDALHTDVVEVAVTKGRGEKLEGRVTNIVERRVKRLVGRLEQMGKAFRVVALDSRVRRCVTVPSKYLSAARHGQDVVVQITDYPQGDKPMQGVVEKILTGRGALDSEEEVIITNHQLPTGFAPDVEEEAKRLYESASMEASDTRRDLTDIPFITIDGESARDFDDAVAAKRLKGGLMRLWVSIADVSHFVQPGSIIDREAYARATSVYFPHKCLPMLPEVLSNDLCSLRPDCERLTMTAQLDIDAKGSVVRREVYHSVIRSRRRMTYTEIKKILVEKDEAVCDAHAELLGGIRLLEECYGRLRGKRLLRGSLDFDLPEPEIIIDLEGDIENIVRAERHVGHMMIEEFMVAANEAVAEALTDAGAGCIYRVHEPPAKDKLREFSVFMHNLGFKVSLGEEVPPKKLASIIEKVRGHAEERVINHKLLRSMSQAVYSPENLGHYGLASTCYCHFTSPIRRYPDLVVHRLLTQLMWRKKPRGTKQALDEIAEHTSRRERIAMQAEREMAKLYAALFMRDHIGESFDGVVAHVGKFGFFVELNEFFVEGIVPIASLTDDRYRFDEHGMRLVGGRRKRIIRIGDPVTIEVYDVRAEEKEIVFELLDDKG